MNRRVVITGIGVVSSVGTGAAEFHRALLEGRNGISRITLFSTEGFPSEYGGEIKDFDARRLLRHVPAASLGRTGQLAAAAARLAIDDAKVQDQWLRERRFGVCVGTSDGESRVIESLNDEWVKTGGERLSPHLVRQSPPHTIVEAVHRELGTTGPALLITTACAAGSFAVGYGFDRIRSGQTDAMLCGGADALSRKTFAGFTRLGTMAPKVCQPFDKNRQGLVVGEGSAMVLLESLDSALERGADIYAEILGYGLNCDAFHMTASNPDSIAAVMRMALQRAGIAASDVDYISAHGTGTRLNDLNEVRAIRSVFGDSPPPVSSIKSMIGHTMGAAGAFSLAACALALRHQFLPPTIHHTEYDEELGIDCVPNCARNCTLDIVQSNAFAFGGSNAIVILGRYANG